MEKTEAKEVIESNIKLCRESLIGYRNAGVAISATLISIAAVLLKTLLESTTPGTIWTDLSKVFLIFSIFFSLLIQFFNYLASGKQTDADIAFRSCMTASFQKKVEKTKIKEYFIRLQTHSLTVVKYSVWAKCFVFVSFALLLIGAIIWILSYPNFFSHILG